MAASWKLDAGPISLEEAQAVLLNMQRNHQQNEPGAVYHLCLAIVEKERGEIMGWCGLDHRDKSQPNPVLFYLLKADYWGQGYATEAANALLRYAFGTLQLKQIDGAAAFDNLASKRVMEKIGMAYLGLGMDKAHQFIIKE